MTKTFEQYSLASKKAWARRKELNPEKWGIPTKADLKLLKDMKKIHKDEAEDLEKINNGLGNT